MQCILLDGDRIYSKQKTLIRRGRHGFVLDTMVLLAVFRSVFKNRSTAANNILPCNARRSLANIEPFEKIDFMLVPRYSIRRLLVITAVCAAFFALVAAAVRGQTWAIATSGAIASVVVILLIQSVLVMCAWWVSLFVGTWRGKPRPKSPFADSSPPPQLISPNHPQ